MQPSKPRPKPPRWSTPCHLIVFIRNLKLLHLDQRKDWPDITLHTLSDSPGNQRKRLKAVEWGLYHLFAILDPETARNKLRPFFPPLEQQQSKHLRDALFWALNELKKNGDLGREITLRKSMLEDCKGEKVDELVAAFSTAVLRKLLASSDDVLPNPAIKLSTAKGLRPDEYQLILPLILAHRVSLGTMSDRRARVQATHEKFSEFLDSKKTELDSRSKESPAVAAEESTDSNWLSHEVKTNWVGSEEWADTLLYGGFRSSTDTFLELPFSSAWSKANSSSIEELSADTHQDLLVDLESLLSRQRNRLRRWRDFSDSVRRRQSNRASINPTESLLAFKDHQALTVASISKAVRQSECSAPLREEDRLLLSSMDEALARISGKLPSDSADSPLHTHGTGAAPSPGAREQSNTLHSPSPGQKESTSPDEPDPQASPCPETGASHTESPPVHISEPKPEPKQEFEPQRNASTLAERAQKSMSLVPPKRPQGNPQSRKARSRPSFAVNQFETPRKQSSHSNKASSGRSTPRDESFYDNADYDSVFKSRPRVAHSPIISPAVHVSPLGESDLSEGDTGSPYGTDAYDLTNSPLAAARPR